MKDMKKKNGKMKHEKNMENNKEMMNEGIKMKGMEDMRIQGKQKMKTLEKK